MPNKISRRLLPKFLILFVLGCLLFVPLENDTHAVFVSCNTCVNNHNSALTQCDIARDTCKNTCDATGGGGYGDVPTCKAACDNTHNTCYFNAGMNEGDCFLDCVPGGGGGGTGGGLTKTPCVNACYAARLSCYGNQGVPDAEDCILEGNPYPICCYNQFQECLAGC